MYTHKIKRLFEVSRNALLNLVEAPVVVLLYHRVAWLESDPQLLAVSPENFRAHIRILKENWDILRFEDNWEKVSSPSIAITFDDGYGDNVRHALPILEQEKVPATFFISTGYLDAAAYWWDELEQIFLSGSKTPDKLVLECPMISCKWETSAPELRRRVYEQILALMKGLDHPTRSELLSLLREWAGRDTGENGGNRPMTNRELITLGSSPFAAIGAHTVSHSSLGIQSVEHQREELVTSKRYLEHCLNREISLFSYPFGSRSDYNADTVRILKEADYHKAASNFPGQWHSWTDPYQIPRHLVRNWNEYEFRRRLERFWFL